MAYQVLSRKWRPQAFEEVVGQKHITDSVQNILRAKRLGQAYMLTGTRGIGKTSVARLFAKSIRCLERKADGNSCGECKSCLSFDTNASMNILELDGASNNSVDDVRGLIANLQTLPTFGDYKVYIIDEVHMLSLSAFNALLKTLEEPPKHVVFIMATTEEHKVPDTVLSRCQRFDFRNASSEIIEKHLSSIVEKENIRIDDTNLLKSIALMAKGSFRDSLSLLDQVLSFTPDNHITEEVVSVSLGMAKASVMRSLCLNILLGNVKEVSSLYVGLLESNIKPNNIAEAILNTFFTIIQEIDALQKVGFNDEEIQSLSSIGIDELFWIYEGLAKDTSWVLESILPEKSLEVLLQKYALRRQMLQSSSVSVNHEVPVKKKSKPVVKSKTWDDFESFYVKDSPAVASQLEHGNIVEGPSVDKNSVRVSYGFSDNSKLFYEHLVQEGSKEKIEAKLKEFFSVENAFIDFVFLENKGDFRSKAEIVEEKIQNTKNEKIDNFKNHPVVKEAEKIFSSSLDKVKLKES